MTITARRERDRPRKNPPGMTTVAGGMRMLSQKGKTGFGMIETCRCRQLFPACFRRMTAPAGGAERARMRILVARIAISERQVPVFDNTLLRVRNSMALIARNLFVGSRNAESRIPVIEPNRLLPILRVMAAITLVGKLPLVNIVVAIGAFLRKAKICMVEIFH
jgi:hypothetical protein